MGQPPQGSYPTNLISSRKEMDFLETNTWSTGQTVAIFLIWGGISLLLALWLAPTIEPTTHSFTKKDLQHDRTLRRLWHVEALLRSVRRERVPMRGNNDLRPDWQAIALAGTPFEFELMLVTSVWGDAGKEYYQYRLKQSPNRWEVEQVVRASQIKIEMA